MIKEKIKKIIRFIANPRLLLCFGIAWFITNGWSYVMLGVGTFLGIGWMIAVASGYLAILWFPFSPEKILTFALSMIILKWLFPDDEKTLGTLRELYNSIKKFKKSPKKASKKRKNDE